MILTGKEIRQQQRLGHIWIDPFYMSVPTTNTYDLRLGKTLRRYTCDVLDPERENPTEEIEIPKEGLVLAPGSLWLGSSVERVGSDRFVPRLHARSGFARLGCFVHITADIIDVGSYGQVTFMLVPTMNIRVRAGQGIAQVSFATTVGEIELYSGKYQGSEGPQASRSFLDSTVSSRACADNRFSLGIA